MRETISLFFQVGKHCSKPLASGQMGKNLFARRMQRKWSTTELRRYARQKNFLTKSENASASSKKNEQPSESPRRRVRASEDLALLKPIRWGEMLRPPSSTKVQEIPKATSLLNEWRTNWLLMAFFPWSVRCLTSAGNTALQFVLDAEWGGQKRRLLVS